MGHTTSRRVAALGGCTALALTFQVPVQAADPTFTTITTPSGRTSLLDAGGANPTFTVSGVASGDVTQVDVYCVRGAGTDVVATLLSSSVPVTAGSFSTTASVPDIGSASPTCRLRGVPSGTPVTDPLSSYAGPLLDIDRRLTVESGGTAFDFELRAGSGDGRMAVKSASRCGDSLMGIVRADLSVYPSSAGCVAKLGPGVAVGPSGAIRVDGHQALLPYAVFLVGGPTLPLTVKTHVAKSGRVTWTESADLVRCKGTDDPQPGQCDNVVPVGVTYQRSGEYAAGGHQISVRDRFVSSDRKRHDVRLTYSMEWQEPPSGALGFAFPGHRGGFHGSTAGQVVTGLPEKAGTFMVRSDRFSSEGDTDADTRAVTWSRPPTRLAFASGDASAFGLGYRLAVPKKGSARLGFTDSLAFRTSTASAMARKAVAGVMSAPTIDKPAKGAVVVGTRTVVKGTVKAGVNGLPVSVKVNGHKAAITQTSADRATYRVVFSEPLGQHTITAVAKDAGGNKRSTSIKVRNR